MRVFFKLRTETIVTQIEKQIETQCSFNKDSKDPGGLENKGQNFQTHFHNIEVCRMSAAGDDDGVPHVRRVIVIVKERCLANFSQ